MAVISGYVASIVGFLRSLWQAMMSPGRRSQSLNEQRCEDVGAIMDDNYYKRDIVIAGKRMASSTTTGERGAAIRDIGHIAWIGGPAVARLASSHLMEFTRILQDEQSPDLLIRQILHAVVEMCVGTKDNQNTARFCGLLEALCTLLESRTPPVRRGAVACIAALVNENYENHASVARMDDIKDKLMRLLQEDWSAWKRNEAARLVLMLGLHRAEEVGKENVD